MVDDDHDLTVFCDVDYVVVQVRQLFLGTMADQRSVDGLQLRLERSQVELGDDKPLPMSRHPRGYKKNC